MCPKHNRKKAIAEPKSFFTSCKKTRKFLFYLEAEVLPPVHFLLGVVIEAEDEHSISSTASSIAMIAFRHVVRGTWNRDSLYIRE